MLEFGCLFKRADCKLKNRWVTPTYKATFYFSFVIKLWRGIRKVSRGGVSWYVDEGDNRHYFFYHTSTAGANVIGREVCN